MATRAATGKIERERERERGIAKLWAHSGGEGMGKDRLNLGVG